MTNPSRPAIQIDLEQFKLHVNIPGRMAMTLQFDTPSRRFYLSLMAFVAEHMKAAGSVSFVPLSPHAETLALLNETVGESAGSSKKKPMLSRIYRKWKNALPDLENAPLFKVLGRKKEFDDGAEKGYRFHDRTKDAWANLFAYQGSGENISLKLHIDALGLNLDDVAVLYGSNDGENGKSPWELFLKSLQEKAGRLPDLDVSKPERSRPAGKEKPGVHSWQSKALLVLLIIMALASLFPFLKSTPVPVRVKGAAQLQSVPTKPAIAVLPFTNINGDPSEDYLSDGITEQIITALAKTPRMLVIARNSSYIYKGKPTKVQEVGRELGVRYVLEGSVQQSGDRIRVTAQLIDAATGHHLWAESYERDMKDLFSLQDDITKEVITALQVKLTEGEAVRIYGKGTENLEAYLKVIKGVHHVYRWNKTDNETGRRLYHEALSLDPEYAGVYTLLGWTFRHDAFFKWTPTPAKSYEKALELGEKALALGDQSSGPYMLFAAVYADTRQPQKALEAAKKGISIDPDSALANWLYGYALFIMGQFRAAIPWIEKAMAIDPLMQPAYLHHLAWSYFWLGNSQKAINTLEKAIEHFPEDGYSRGLLANAFLQIGKTESALEEIDKALTLHPKVTIWYTATRAVALHAAGRSDEAIALMEKLQENFPENPDVLRHFGRLMGLNGRHEEGVQMTEKAVRLRPGEYTHLYLGRQYVMAGQYEKAVPELKEAIRLSPDRLLGHLWLAAAFSLSDKMVEARSEMETMKRLNPDFTLEGCVQNSYNQYPPADKKRFLDALQKAGLR